MDKQKQIRKLQDKIDSLNHIIRCKDNDLNGLKVLLKKEGYKVRFNKQRT